MLSNWQPLMTVNSGADMGLSSNARTGVVGSTKRYPAPNCRKASWTELSPVATKSPDDVVALPRMITPMSSAHRYSVIALEVTNMRTDVQNGRLLLWSPVSSPPTTTRIFFFTQKISRRKYQTPVTSNGNASNRHADSDRLEGEFVKNLAFKIGLHAERSRSMSVTATIRLLRQINS